MVHCFYLLRCSQIFGAVFFTVGVVLLALANYIRNPASVNGVTVRLLL